MKPSGPLKRNGIKLAKTQRGWNSTVPPISEKRRMEDKALQPHLKAYREKFPRCQGRRCQRQAEHVHEIAGGSALRMKARARRACILHLCGDCHVFGSNPVQDWPKVEQLALKLLADPEGYDLDAYNEVVKGYLKPIEQEEVDRAIETITSN